MPVILEPDLNPSSSLLHAVYEWRTFRFLLDTGETLDVRAIIDDSVLRQAVLTHTKAKKIEGVAWLKDPEPMDAIKSAPSKRPAKTLGRQVAG